MANKPLSITSKFECDFPGCHKSFSRKDHLRRHYMNHDDNAVLHGCSYPGCKMEFKRYDVMVCHYERHFKRRKLLNEDQEADGSKSSSKRNQSSPIIKVNIHNIAERDILPLQNNIIDWLLNSNELFLDDTTANSISSNLNNTHNNTQQGMYPEYQFSKSLIHKKSANSMLQELLNRNFETKPTFQTNSSLLTPEVLKTLLHMIPNLVHFPDFNIPTLEFCMNVYWCIFHIQFPIIHRASFSCSIAHPLLVVAMIMIGSVLSHSTRDILKDPFGMSLAIGTDLRWLIFKNRKHGHFQLWELQSLLILEVYEKYFANRELYERSSIHYAAKVEIIKRSAANIEDSYDSNSEKKYLESTEQEGEVLWNKWIVAECMKRCTLMSFCFDLTNSMISSHNSTFIDKLKLELPCNDLLWEASIENLKRFSAPADCYSIHDCLKKLLKGEKIETSSFGKKVLLHTLTLLIVQFENRDKIGSLIGNISEDTTTREWRERISYALDIWKYNVNGNCSDVRNLIINSQQLEKNSISSLYLQSTDTRCKCPTYHMAHIRLHVVTNDVLIYAEAPLSIKNGSQNEGYQEVTMRMKAWADSLNGRIGVVHAYLCLFECLLSQDRVSYSFKIDPIPERRQVVVMCSLIIWCYNYIVYGSESNKYFSKDKDHFKETAFHYLNKLHSRFKSIIITNQNAIDFHLSVRKCANNLPDYENTHYIAGFMNEISQLFKTSFWGLATEYSKLFEMCKERSLGKEKKLL